MLYHFPKQTAFGRVLPKSKIYQHSSPSAAVKALFTQQVEQIQWAYKLAPATLNIPASIAVPEIQVFRIRLKTDFARGLHDSDTIHREILRCIDKAIPFPLLFEIIRSLASESSQSEQIQTQTQVIAAYKRPNEADASKWYRGQYFAGDWQTTPADDSERSALPIALNMDSMYQQLLSPMLPQSARPHEALQQHTERCEAIIQTEKELAKQQAKLNKEKQFNRKVEINNKVRNLQHTLTNMTSMP